MDDDAISDLFAATAQVSIRRMFGGKGIYIDGLIVALVVGGELLLKADETSAADFADAGSRQWVYEGSKKRVAMPYWSVPDVALDDPDEFAEWARKALDASIRAAKAKPAIKVRSPGKPVAKARHAAKTRSGG